MKTLLLICILIAVASAYLNPLPVLETGGPTVATLEIAEGWQGGDALLFSSVLNSFFAAGQPIPNNALFAAPGFATQLEAGGTLDFDLVTEEVGWPNDFQFLPAGSSQINLPFPAVVGVSGRFPTAPRFVLPSFPGSVFIIDVSSLPGTVIEISRQEQPCSTCELDGCDTCGCEWYYQQFVFYDVDGDGRQDILTVRTRDQTCNPLPIFPPFLFLSEFVAFLQPENPLTDEWELFVLHDFEKVVNRGSVGFFSFVDLDAALTYPDGSGMSEDPEDLELSQGSEFDFEPTGIVHPTPELVYGEFYGLAATIYSVDPGNTWVTPGKTVHRTIVDDTLGFMYSAQVLDINGDGRSEIVATTHTTRDDNGIYAYEISSAFREQTHVGAIRHPLAVNFTVFGREPSPARLRPADFVASLARDEKKPELVIGTDGGGQAIYLVPKNQNKNDWEYTQEVLAESGCDFLTPIAFDINGDERSEVSVACLADGAIYSWTSSKKN